MESLVQGLTKVYVYIDNASVGEEDHLHNIGQVLEWFEFAGLSLKNSKCVMGKSTYWSYWSFYGLAECAVQILKNGIQKLKKLFSKKIFKVFI